MVKSSYYNLDETISASGVFWQDLIKNRSFNSKVATMSKQLNLSRLASACLVQRGFDEKTANNFLNPKLDSLSEIPNNIKDLALAAKKIGDTIKAKKTIGIISDYDVDGETSAAIANKYLNYLDIKNHLYIPNRIKEGYGLNEEAIKQLALKHIDLLITLDCGATSINEIEYANNLGIEVVVIDHHSCKNKNINSFAHVNPNRSDDNSGFGYLCTASLLFFVLQKINEYLQENNYSKSRLPNVIGYIDLIALAIICDVVPTIGVNRTIIHHGLKLLAHAPTLGLNVLIQKLKLGAKIKVSDLGFAIGPRINAAGRMGDSYKVYELFNADSEDQASKICDELEAYNTKRKIILERAVKLALDQAYLQTTDILILSNEFFHKGVIGLIAAEVSTRIKQPTIILSSDESVSTGSARSVGDFDIGEAIRLAEKEGILIKGGGHAMAAGLKIENSKIPDLIDFMNKNYQKIKKENISKIKRINVTTNIFPDEMNYKVADELSLIEPFGIDNPEPVFLLERVNVLNLERISTKRLKISLKLSNGKLFVSFFDRTENPPVENYLVQSHGKNIDLLVTVRTFIHNEIQNISLNIFDARPSSSSESNIFV